ncbi:MAG: methyl-accepting chemotaxis protein, partial [Motiliproteus sp.]
AVREVKKKSVENYFKDVKRQVQTFSENQMIKESMVNFSDRIDTFRDFNDIDEATLLELRAALKTFYLEDFSNEYKSANDGKSPADVEKIIDELSDDAVALQYYYIKANENPIGSKQDMPRASDLSSYTRAHAYVHPTIQSFQQKFGFADIYLVDAKTGSINYSVMKELDYGTSLVDGPYANSGLAKVFNAAKGAFFKDAVFYSDFGTYYPAYEAPSMFISSPIMDGTEVAGVAIFQLKIDRLNLIMAERTGLGSTGETYLVGGDRLMRSDSNADYDRSVENSLKNPDTTQAKSLAIDNALKGQSGFGVVVNYLDKPVLSSWVPVRVGSFSWALLAEIDVTEALSPVDEAGVPFYQKYANSYGYEDLLLINPDGYAFYTVESGKESRTNLLTGPYKDTRLASLVKRVSETGEFGFADFSQYAPSDNAPASFIAQPLMNEGKAELIVALRLPLQGVNNIMAIRDGMGESGESYLVGPDKRMRSDSFSDPQNRSVSASFAGNVANNGIDSQAVNSALGGSSGTEVIVNHQGKSVLTAYAPLTVGDQTWAMIAEVDEAEAFASRASLQWLTVIVLVVAVVLIVFVGVFLARRISEPLASASRLAQLVSAGDLTTKIEVKSTDEIGQLQGALKEMTEGLRDMVSQIGSSADQQASAAEQLSSITDQTRDHVQEQNTSTELVAAAITQMSATVVEVSRNTSDAAQAAAVAKEEVEHGNREVKAVIDAIHTFASEVDMMAGNLKDVEDGAENIGGIIGVINGIADQTNLLALNAAIEAARAGDQGRGFAVVADEVRSLAQSTQDSTKQIEKMIYQLQEGAKASAQAMNRGKDQMEQVVLQAESTGSALQKINDSVDRISEMSMQIASAADQQSVVAEDINQNVNHISELSQQTGSDAEQISVASEELARLAADLQSQTRRFKM